MKQKKQKNSGKQTRGFGRKEDWIDNRCEEIETCLNKNNSKGAYQPLNDQTSEKQSVSTIIQNWCPFHYT